MASINNYIKGQSVAVVSDDTTSLTLTFVNIMSTSSDETILKSGDIVYIICTDTGLPVKLTLNADVSFNSTRLTFASTVVEQLIPAGSVVLLEAEKRFDRTHSSLQYITFSSQAATAAVWKTFSSSGISNHSWNTTNSDSGTTVGTSQLTNISTAIQSVGIVMPYDCTLVGFRATIYRVGNFQTAVGLFCGTPAYNDNATQDFTLRAYAAADNSEGPDSNYSQRPVKAVDLSRSFSLAAGDIILPAFNSVTADGGNARISYTIVLKTTKIL
jgi:hypothetical protein